MAVTQVVKQQIITLRAEGLSYAKIAEQTKVSKQTAIDIVGEQKDAVSTLEATQWEALFEATKVNLKGRIDQLTALQNRLREEIERRDLSDLPTKDLVNLYLSTTKSLKEEVFTPTIQTTGEQQSAAQQRDMFNW
jgi:transposase